MFGGQVAETPDAARQLMRNALAKPKLLDQNISAAYDWLKKEQKAGKVGTVGWCFGGTMSFEAAQLLSNRLGAAVIYYGFVNDRKDELARIKAPVLGLFGGQDESIPASTVEGFRKTLEAQGARPIIRIYPEAGHAFANPSGRNFRREDAEDAWRRTLDFLGENLTS
jgi:carboxymethylenebutenolidase